MNKTGIQWTDLTWNPISGCNKISPACDNCYAERMAKRLGGRHGYDKVKPFAVTLHPQKLYEPLKIKKTHRIFIVSMGDLFHPNVPIEYVKEIFSVMNQANWHTFICLTKRAENMYRIAENITWTDNIWQGVTVKNGNYIQRIKFLQDIPSKIKFVSFEPLLGNITNLNLNNIDWAIVGGETGRRSRPMKKEWVLNIKNQCESACSFVF